LAFGGGDCGLPPSDAGDCGRFAPQRSMMLATAVAPVTWPQTAVAALIISVPTCGALPEP